MYLTSRIAATVTCRATMQAIALANLETACPSQPAATGVTGTDGRCRRRRDEKRVARAAAKLLATVSGVVPGAAVAAIATVTTTQQYGPSSSTFDVLFTPVESATDLVSISAGSVYTGEAAQLTIEAIASDDTILPLFADPNMNPWFTTAPLSSVTNNTFADFSAHDIKGLRFTVGNFSGPQPTLTLPVGTDFVFTAVPEPGVGLMLACSLAAALIGRRFTKQLSARTGDDVAAAAR
jgi:hypothetical protein